MSILSAITATDAWHRYEHKFLRFTVTDSAGAAVNLSAVSLTWRLFDSERTAVITKTTAVSPGGITITGGSSNIAQVEIAETSYASVVPGLYRHELWDITNDLLLSYGDVELLDATAPE